MNQLLIWYKKNKRELPWRNQQQPYKVWVSEVILQQTKIETGLGYYQRFIKKFPNLVSLANANQDQVLKLWQGLGYYSRARNMHAASQHIVNDLNSVFPSNFNDLKQLKGVGDYTAAAIASICFKEKVPAIDGNAYRVYARYFNVDYDISKSNAKNYFFDLAKQVIDPTEPGDFNQAIMDLGSTICTPKNPKCHQCPLKDSCLANQLQNQTNLPVKSKKVVIKKLDFHFKIFIHQNQIIIQQNKQQGIWQQLYVFPTSNEPSNQKFLKANAQFAKPTLIHSTTHLLTHRKLNIRFWLYQLNQDSFFSYQKNDEFLVVNKCDLGQYAWPKPIEIFLQQHQL